MISTFVIKFSPFVPSPLFPSLLAKVYQEKMKKHNYENIQLQMAASKKEPRNSKPDSAMKNAGDQQPVSQTHTYINVVDNAHLAEEYSTIPPPPPELQMRDSGTSPSRATPLTPTPSLSQRDNCAETGRERSPTPPVPERHYSDSDLHMTPPPPLPQRQYSNEDTLEPAPPLPERRYTASDVALGRSGPPQPMMAAAGLTSQVQQSQEGGATAREELESRDRPKSLELEAVDDGESNVGNHYARVIKMKLTNEDGSPKSPPPLPKRVRERFNENSPYISNENLSQSGGVVKRSGYVDVEHSESSSEVYLGQDTIAYAVVKVDGSSGDSHSKDVPVRQSRTPRPYENPILAPPSLTTAADGKPKRVPAYEEVDIVDSHKVDGKLALHSWHGTLIRCDSTYPVCIYTDAHILFC